VRTSCERFIRDMKRGDIYYDAAAPAAVEAFFSDCLYVIVPALGARARPKKSAFNLLPWQQFVIGNMFGWKWKRNGLRRFTDVFITTAKSSGKSPLGAACCLWFAGPENEMEAEIYVGAAGFDQAGIPFKDIVNMIRSSPTLSREFVVHGGSRPNLIICPRKGSIIKRVAFKSPRSGFRPSMLLFDEIHEHPSGEMLGDYTAGLKNRAQPMTLSITNTGEDMTGVFGDMFKRGVAACVPGSTDDEFFSYICSLDEEDVAECFDNEDCWVKANPSLDVVIGRDYYKRQVNKARTQPLEWANVRRLNFCVPTKTKNPLVSVELWNKSLIDELPDVSKMDMVVGIDLSHSTSGTAIASLWVDKSDDTFYMRCLHYLPEDKVADRSQKENFEYHNAAAAGELITMPGPIINLDFVVDEFVRVMKENKMVAFATDTYKKEDFLHALDVRSVPYWIKKDSNLKSSGGPPEYILAGMGLNKRPGELWMNDGIELFLDRLETGKLKVLRNPVTTFHILNATAYIGPNNNKKIERGKHGERTVDGAIAMNICLSLAKYMGMCDNLPVLTAKDIESSHIFIRR